MRSHRLRSLVMGALLTAALGWSQSNEIVDTLISEERATMGGAAYLALTAAGLVDVGATAEDAVAELRSRPWGFADSTAQDPVTLGSLGHLLLEAFELRGGVLYSIFPGKRYAAREVVFRGWLPGSAAAGRLLSGREVTHIVGKVLESLGQREEEVSP